LQKPLFHGGQASTHPGLVHDLAGAGISC
jgi:hypothetical protein